MRLETVGEIADDEVLPTTDVEPVVGSLADGNTDG